MSHLGVIPAVLVALSTLTFIISYIIGVLRGDISALFPYISDTGSKRPESCIFGLLLNIAAFLAFSVMFFRFKIVQSLTNNLIEDRWIRRLNKSSFVAGIISCFGVTLVANFQEKTDVEDVHLVGAGLTFCVGIFYCFLQTALSYQMYPEFNGRRICKVRLAISLISLLTATITAVVTGTYASHQWNSSTSGDSHSKFKWSSDDPGYATHIVSTAGEWVTALSFFCFFLTFVSEFNKFEVEVTLRPLVLHMDQNPTSMEDAVNERTKLLS